MGEKIAKKLRRRSFGMTEINQEGWLPIIHMR
jgi:hypothetical protein